MSVIVDAINRAAGRSGTHIRTEVFECQPSGANRYAATPIATIRMAILIAASIQHSIPRSIFWRTVHAVFGFRPDTGTIFYMQTSARFCSAVANWSCWLNNLCATVASKLPYGRITRPTTGKFNGGEAIVALTGCDLREFSIVSHFDLQNRLKWLGPAGGNDTALGPLLYQT